MTSRRRSSPSTRWLWAVPIFLAGALVMLMVSRSLEEFHASTVLVYSLGGAGCGLSLAGFIAAVVGARKSKAENRAALARAQARLEAKRAARRG